MRRTHRAAAMLALSLALVSATTAVAAAAPSSTGIEDQNDRLLRNLKAAQAERTQAAVELARSMEHHFNATTARISPAAIEDRLLRNLKAAQAERTQAAVALARSMEHNLTPVATDVPAAPPAAQPDTATPGSGVDLLATLLVGLIGGLVGGAATIGGWIVTTRRHRPRPAAAA
jgi:hypothetical protein